jgi:hypothetical protein
MTWRLAQDSRAFTLNLNILIDKVFSGYLMLIQQFVENVQNQSSNFPLKTNVLNFANKH